MGPKKLGPKKLWIEKILGTNKFWVTKKTLGPKQSLGLKKLYPKINLRFKKNVGSKKRLKKIWGSNKIVGLKIFIPTFLFGRKKNFKNFGESK